jgi:hypothetical protein
MSVYPTPRGSSFRKHFHSGTRVESLIDNFDEPAKSDDGSDPAVIVLNELRVIPVALRWFD